MIVQFPEANAQYEYQHESKRFMKVVTPRDNDGEEELYQQRDESIDCTLEEITDGIKARPTAKQNSERVYEMKSPGSKMR